MPEATTTTTKGKVYGKNGKKHKRWGKEADAVLKKYVQLPRLKRDELILLRRGLHYVEGFIRSKHAISVRLSWLKCSKIATVKPTAKVGKLVRWSDAETAMLKANLSLENLKICKLFPNRTSDAIRIKANKIRRLLKGFKLKVSAKKGVGLVHWTYAEKKVLAQNFDKKPRELVKLFPNRSYNAVQFKQWQMRHKQSQKPKAVVAEKQKSVSFDCVEDKYQPIMKNAFERLAKTGEAIKPVEAYFFGLEDGGWDDFLKEVLFKTALIKDAYGVKVTVKNGKVVGI